MEWEIEIEVTVKKTLVLSGPLNSAAALSAVTSCVESGMPLSTFQKWESDGQFNRKPIEELIKIGPTISIKEV